MNEIRSIIEAFDKASGRDRKCALATIVSVEGSSYRHPGARMLVCEDGSSTGTISAGCLEADVIEHAKNVIHSGAATLVEYDTTSTSDEMAWGLGLGCNGIVRLLVEPLLPGSLSIETLRRLCEPQGDDRCALVATVYRYMPPESAPAGDPIEIGARMVIDENGVATHEKLSDAAAAMFEYEMRELIPEAAASEDLRYEVDGGAVSVFIETILPPVRLVVFGAGLDALPVVELASRLGWQTEVVDPQARPGSISRFAMAQRVILARPEEIGEHIVITPRTLTLLMSHDYVHDAKLLEFLLGSPAPYIGVMGPRRRTDRMLGGLGANGEGYRLDETDRQRLYSPVGLDIGADSPAEIALSIIAEMRAVLSRRSGGMLRERQHPARGGSGRGERITMERDLPVIAS